MVMRVKVDNPDNTTSAQTTTDATNYEIGVVHGTTDSASLVRGRLT